jgi:large subunit ribosomal protein L21
MFAVIKTGGKQYRVAADDVLTIEKLEVTAGDIVEFTEVLVIGEGADVVEHNRGKKVIAFKKRRRQNSKRSRGHRQHHTVVRITDIVAAK